jgi:hypothetical protein
MRILRYGLLCTVLCLSCPFLNIASRWHFVSSFYLKKLSLLEVCVVISSSVPLKGTGIIRCCGIWNITPLSAVRIALLAATHQRDIDAVLLQHILCLVSAQDDTKCFDLPKLILFCRHMKLKTFIRALAFSVVGTGSQCHLLTTESVTWDGLVWPLSSLSGRRNQLAL